MKAVIAQTKENLKSPTYMMEACKTFIMIFAIIFPILLSMSEYGLTYAQSSGGSSGGAVNFEMNEQINTMFGLFRGLADIFIKIAYGLMVLVFAVGMVKSGLTAQTAQQFGAAGRVSGEIMNVLGGIVVFVFGILSYPLVDKIVSNVVNNSGVAGNMSTGDLILPGIGQ